MDSKLNIISYYIKPAYFIISIRVDNIKIKMRSQLDTIKSLK